MNLKFVLNCPNDRQVLSRKKIFIKAVIYLVLLMVAALILRVLVGMLYDMYGINPLELTNFKGEPTNFIHLGIARTLWTLLILAPVTEEILFRLPLSFNRKTVALWLALVPIIIVFHFCKCTDWRWLVFYIALGILVYLLFSRLTKDTDWKSLRTRYIIPSMWLSAISFGLIHLIAFSTLNLQLLPWALATVIIPMAAGCAMTYARVNLGFFWGLLIHQMTNLPDILLMIFTNLFGPFNQ